MCVCDGVFMDSVSSAPFESSRVVVHRKHTHVSQPHMHTQKRTHSVRLRRNSVVVTYDVTVVMVSATCWLQYIPVCTLPGSDASRSRNNPQHFIRTRNDDNTKNMSRLSVALGKHAHALLDTTMAERILNVANAARHIDCVHDTTFHDTHDRSRSFERECAELGKPLGRRFPLTCTDNA